MLPLIGLKYKSNDHNLCSNCYKKSLKKCRKREDKKLLENEILVLKKKVVEQKQTIDNQSLLIESLRKDSSKLLEKEKVIQSARNILAKFSNITNT
jgi:hypothetical protein